DYELEELLEEPLVYGFGESVVEAPLISFYALTRENTYKTMRVKAYIGKHTVHSLIDYGRTHTLLDLKVDKKLGCDIKWNFKDLVMDFVYNNKRMVLRGTQKATLQWMCRKRPPKEIISLQANHGQLLRFVRNYAIISKPLTTLLKKNPFAWNPSAQVAFEELKLAMIQAPILALPDFNQLFTVETSFRHGNWAVLRQGGHPITYLSKYLSPKHQALSTYEKEFYAVLMALEKWR
ncbi:retrovirus-related pol polyprotein from transposon 17.6, partial [Tanacetum coccineum]